MLLFFSNKLPLPLFFQVSSRKKKQNLLPENMECCWSNLFSLRIQSHRKYLNKIVCICSSVGSENSPGDIAGSILGLTKISLSWFFICLIFKLSFSWYREWCSFIFLIIHFSSFLKSNHVGCIDKGGTCLLFHFYIKVIHPKHC